MRRIAFALVTVHMLVLLSHNAAHRELGVQLNVWQTIFAYSVIVAGPIFAAAVLFTRHQRLGYALLAVSMFGALVFGVYHHYILVSPDHVAHLPTGESQGHFRATAAVMGIFELAGVALGIWGWRSHSKLPRAT
jgi:hypothetical protein